MEFSFSFFSADATKQQNITVEPLFKNRTKTTNTFTDRQETQKLHSFLKLLMQTTRQNPRSQQLTNVFI
jgi:hypothetical protein